MEEQKISQNQEQNKTENNDKKPLLVILGILLVIALVLTAFGYDIYRIMFNPIKVKALLFEEIKESNLVPAVFAFFSEQRARERIANGEALSGVSEPDIPLLMSFIQLEDWRSIKQLLVEDEFITHLVSVSVDGTYAWIDSEDINPQITWNMTPLKTNLTGQPGKDSIMVGYMALPECTQKEIDDFSARLAASPPGVEILYNLCRFPAPWKEDQIDDYSHALIDVNNNLPAEFAFSKMLETRQGSAARLMPLVKDLLKSIQWIGRWGWAICVLIIGLIFLVNGKKWPGNLKAIGTPFVITAGILLVSCVLGLGMLNKWLVSLLLTQSSEVVKTEMAASLTRLLAEVNKPLWIEAGVLLVVGISMLVISRAKIQRTTL